MKKKILFTLAILLLVTALTSCSFVTYHPFEKGEKGFEEKLEEYLTAISTLSDISYYADAEKPRFEIALQDAVNELKECKTVAELQKTFDQHKKAILMIPTQLPNVIASLLEKLDTLVDLEAYRPLEKSKIITLKETYAKLIGEATDIPEAEKLFASVEADIGALKTDAIYYAEELATMKTAFSTELDQYKTFVFYDKEEQKILEDLIKAFRIQVKSLTEKEKVEALYRECLAEMDGVITRLEKLKAECDELIAIWQERFTDLGLDSALREHLMGLMEELTHTEEINRFAAEYLLEHLALSVKEKKDLAETILENGIVESLYREEDRREADRLVSLAKAELLLASEGKLSILVDKTLTALATIPTNEERWQEEDQAFLEKLKEIYGDSHLALPESLTEAADYYELAAIIDFYAFYQTDYDAFLRDTFRVKLLFDRKNPQWEINEVYWYAELLRSAVGITGYYEEDGEHLVITLVPYAIGTESNLKDEITTDRYDSLIELPNKDKHQPRDKDFNDFAYLSYEKTLNGIWNTQQLWYALEHGYRPITVKGSPAEAALEKAKEILREIVCEGMTVEEKVYSIFNWFGQHVVYDLDYLDYLNPENKELFPDELTAALKSFQVEGALFENLAVCCSFAKSYLLFLRIEGIEAYRITLHEYTENKICGLWEGSYGSHAILAIRGSDGKFFYSDTEQCYNYSASYPFLAKFHQLMVPEDKHWPYDQGYTRLFPEITISKGLPMMLTETLTYKGESILIKEKAQLETILSAFSKESATEVQLSLFADNGTSLSMITSVLSASGITYTTYTFGGLTEFMLYR